MFSSRVNSFCNTYKSSLLSFVLLVASVATSPLAANAQLTRAGSSITNQASATYTDTTSGTNVKVDSNTVSVLVQPVEALALTQDNTVRSQAGAPVVLPHRLTNTGNVRTSYDLTVRQISGDDYDLSNLQLIHDINGNGRPDPGEPVVANTQLDMGESMDLVVSGNVPATVGANRTSQVQITATTADKALSADNTDTIKTNGGVSLQLVKTVSVAEAKPGETVEFTLTGTNNGNSSPPGAPVVIDGNSVSRIVLRDALPVNTSLSLLQAPSSAQALYHIAGEATQTYTSQLPTDTSNVDAIAVALPSFAPQSALAVTLKVRLSSIASGDIFNTGRFYYTEPSNNQVDSVKSNTVQVHVPTLLPSINYYTNGQYQRIAYQTNVGNELHIQVNAANCNLNASKVETITVIIHSAKSGDDETFTATETGPNTGMFRIDQVVDTQNYLQHSTGDNDVVETAPHDTLTAWATCNGIKVLTTILVDPFGVVFDSKSNATLAGARVTIIDVTGQGNGGKPGQPAIVYGDDGITPVDNVVTTGADGTFLFPLVKPSTYRLAIETPLNYTFPSKVAIGDLPAGRFISASGSFGGNFLVSVPLGTVQIDVPLDPVPAINNGLFVEKSANRSTVEIGDFLDYTVRVRNANDNAITNVNISDLLPVGFSYVKGTARNGNTKLADPIGGTGPRLTFNIGNMESGQQVSFSYRVNVNTGAHIGKASNKASASGQQGATVANSNMASATVEVQGGIFDSKGIIIGRVFVDRNRNGVVDPGEPGIPGVRIYLEDGTFVITDGEGMYDIYGVSARTHVLKVDTTTLPVGAKLAPISNANANKGDSAFVDLKIGELHKTNFAEITAAPSILKEIEARRAKISQYGEVDAAITHPLNSELQNQNADPLTLPASGIVNAPAAPTTSGDKTGGKRTAKTNVVPTTQAETTGPEHIEAPALNADNSNLPPAPVAPTQTETTDAPSLPADLDNTLGFVDLKEGDTMASNQTNVRIKGGQGSTFTLKVNGEAIADTRIGNKSTIDSAQAEVWEYIGVRLNVGKNTLEVTETDSFGNARGTQKITIIAPGSAGKIELTVPGGSQYADSKSLVQVKVRLTDGNGTQVSARTPITLESSGGRWQVADINPNEKGVQVFIEGGVATFALQAPSVPGDVVVRVTSGILDSSAKISFVPELRPMLANGLVDAKLNLFGFKPKSVRAEQTSELFDQELQGLSAGNDRAQARTAMFLKGQVQGKYLLTMRYDSQGQQDNRLFRDIQPDQYYPVYGDDAVKGYDAQSSSKLYVRVDKDKSYVLMGDFVTSTQNDARSLGEYSRSFNGIRAHHETDKVSANFFASRDNSRQIIDELRGRGTSGPYPLTNSSLLDQSEKVELIIRDRNQPSVILSVTPQTRFVDYQLDSLSGGVLFRHPVPSVDEDLNPVFVRVTYEINQGGPKFTVAGADAQVKVASNLEVGAALVRDQNPQNHFDMRTVNATYRISSDTTLIGEWAHTSTDEKGSGGATRLELVHQGQKLTARAFIGQADNQFDNPASVLGAGRQEASLKGTYQVGTNDLIKAEAIRTKDTVNGGTNEGGQLSLEHTFANKMRLEVGVRHAKGTDTNSVADTPVDFTSVRAKLTTPVPGNDRANVFAEYEQDIKDSSQKVFALGGTYQLNDRSRLYVRHELLSSLSGRYALNDDQDQHATVAGIDMDYARNAHVFSEYRINNGISGREAEASIGLRNGWNLAEGLRLNTTFERVHSLGGGSATEAGDNSTAITGALEYTRSDNFKGTIRLESRNGSSGHTLLASAGAAYKMSPDLTFLTKAIMNSGDGAQQSGLYNRLLMGVAYRQTRTDRFNALAKFELRHGRPGDATATDGTSGSMLDSARILSLDANYQPSRLWLLSMHYGAKWSRLHTENLTDSQLTQILAVRLLRQMGQRSNISLMGTISPGGSGSHRAGLGVEYDYRLRDNLWLGLGFNTQNSDPDLLGEDAPHKGVYLRLRWKFDESLFGNSGLQDAGQASANGAPAAPALTPTPITQ